MQYAGSGVKKWHNLLFKLPYLPDLSPCDFFSIFEEASLYLDVDITLELC